MHDVLSPRAASKNNPVDRSVNDRLLPSFALNQLHLVTKITPFWHRHQRNKIDQIQIIEITPQTRNINAPSRQNQNTNRALFVLRSEWNSIRTDHRRIAIAINIAQPINNHLSNVCTLFTDSARRGRVAAIGRARTVLAAVPLIRSKHVQRRGEPGWKAFARACTRQLIGTYVKRRRISWWKKPLENPLSAVSPWSSWGKQIWRCATSGAAMAPPRCCRIVPENQYSCCPPIPRLFPRNSRSHVHWQRYLPRRAVQEYI